MPTPKKPIRNIKGTQDLGHSDIIRYNDGAGADKVIVVEPYITRAVVANENIGTGKYVKITGTSYTLDLIGRDYDPAQIYPFQAIVAQGTDIYMANEPNITGTFDDSKWTKVAQKQIPSIPITAGSVVTTGRWHNTVTVVGFLVDDQSEFDHAPNR